MVSLGLLYENGKGVPQDYAKAREWYEKAAAKDNADAKTRLQQLPVR
jgi:TPR repeat protein